MQDAIALNRGGIIKDGQDPQFRAECLPIDSILIPFQQARSRKMATILVLNGPNLNLLGKREPTVYGTTSLASIQSHLTKIASEEGHQLHHFQSNAEAELINRIHQAGEEGINIILFNPGAFTHTSIALRDALLGCAIPFIEVHLSNPHGREDFRKQNFFSDIAMGIVAGFGANSYEFALRGAFLKLQSPSV
jgi:3-dehydroquinate dehydratase II